MRTFFSIILIFSLVVSCKTEQKKEKVKIPKAIVLAPIIKQFGLDFKKYSIVYDTIKSGDSFGKLMIENKVPYPKVARVVDFFKDTFDVKRIQVGRPYILLKSKDTLQNTEFFIYENDRIKYTVVDLRDSVNAYTSKKKIKTIQREVAGIIENSLSESLDKLEVDYAMTIKLSEIYAWTIDFFQLEKGDKFKVIYEERYINDSIYAGTGEVSAAYFEHRGVPIYAFPYRGDSLKSIDDYYDQDANNLRSTFLRAPIKFGYRVSSRYNLNRRIAFYGFKRRPHKGTDYAAPVGTPIIATADGTVVASTRAGGNGRYVKIRHNATYSTQYLHMRKQKVKKGAFVRQGDVIGWVGMTGNTGGPHVCYRFWKNDAQVDPLREKLPTAEPLADSLRTTYMKYIAPKKEQLDCLSYQILAE